MTILRPYIYRRFDELVFGFSTKIDVNARLPFYFNLSLSVGDDKEKVLNNRKKFFSALGLSAENAAFQKQVHGDKIRYVTEPGNIEESDAMITKVPGIALCISTADCTPVFIYDPEARIIAAIHSGWRGTQKRITEKTVEKLTTEFKCSPENMFVYLGPAICQANYQAGKEVADYFDKKYLIKDDNKFLLDISSANYDMLVGQGIHPSRIQQSSLCSFDYKEVFHSYRRDGKTSGRSIGTIALKPLNNE